MIKKLYRGLCYHGGMSADNICPRCNLAIESFMHIFRDCDDVKSF